MHTHELALASFRESVYIGCLLHVLDKSGSSSVDSGDISGSPYIVGTAYIKSDSTAILDVQFVPCVSKTPFVLDQHLGFQLSSWSLTDFCQSH